IKLGKANILREGKDVAIIATGIMVNEAIIAVEQLKEKGIDAMVIDMHTIKPIDEEAILSAAKKTKAIVTAEEHSIIGGLGSAVAEVLAQKYPTKMAFVGQEDTYGESGKPEDLKKKYKMTADDIVKKTVNLLG
ncbi:MAG: transketolase family protein, partial [Clostridiales bacterium]|nr:transketolase family protein [Clostridiales bacterium]